MKLNEGENRLKYLAYWGGVEGSNCVEVCRARAGICARACVCVCVCWVSVYISVYVYTHLCVDA